MRRSLYPAILCCVGLTLTLLVGGAQAQTAIYDSGGPLMPEQAAYDVTFYDLDVDVRPADSTISGRVRVEADIVQPLEWFVLDLDTTLAVTSVAAVGREGGRRDLAFERRGGQIWAPFPTMKQPGETVRVEVAYGGQPRVAPNPPWEGGVTWDRTPNDAPWIATTCQQEGADLWWPVKDHVSDEPDSMSVHVTVPEPLVAASNGALRTVEPVAEGRRTYHWVVSTPINVYNVALNIAPYRIIEDSFQSVAGDTFPVKLWVLPSDYENGKQLFTEIKQQLRWYEETLGPYPFRTDKYGVAQTPHLGMEHQSIIAYGADFDNTALSDEDWGYDTLHHHELSHEWWGNLVTNADWRDMWLHEGFGTYMQALYAEHLHGREAYHRYAADMREGVENDLPIAPSESKTSTEIYEASLYAKGGSVLHTLRYLLGDEAFFEALRRMAYPDPAMREVTSGEQCRFATTRDFITIAERASGRELDWFFDVYVRQAELPRLVTERHDSTLTLRWDVPDGSSFPMPVEVDLGTETRRVEMDGGRATVPLRADADPIVDPQQWILKDKAN